MTGRHMGIKTLLMQNLSYMHHLCGLHNTFRIAYDILSAHKGAATMLLTACYLPVDSMNCFWLISKDLHPFIEP